ncbi:HdeD family acid-resistance protein [Microvirga sp. VF16]|uniref:HdeD family acid-resistance protein n=1 Tax=Microvirga sp. VF16 TaxID=2807101 RepID=UPI00193C878B|nr:HdeD family acid-resistance protein [Microvirga sp. VF16]QRM35914.1 HdeD family acid-resistance protein [Microvirga sp. VF16]
MKSALSRWDQVIRPDDVIPKWACFVVGTTFFALSVLAFANLLVGAAPPVRFIGAMMALGAVALLLHAILVIGRSGFYPWLFSGILYGVAGMIAYLNPGLSSVPSLLGLVLGLGMAGILRILTAVRLRPQVGWRWLALSGAVTIAASVVVAMGRPVDHAWLFGAVLAADLSAQGVAAIAFGLALRPPPGDRL